jgi:ribosomal protein S18 acetylase RimI-like enzyme
MLITTKLADISDKDQLISYFKYYNKPDFALKKIEAYLSFGKTIIAKEDDKIAGILQFYIKENPNDGVIEFEKIQVLLPYQRKGIGSILLEKGIEEAKKTFQDLGIKLRKICLYVSEDNKAAQNFYIKHNFKKIASLNDLYVTGRVEQFFCLDL